jgi:hypothetical protein
MSKGTSTDMGATAVAWHMMLVTLCHVSEGSNNSKDNETTAAQESPMDPFGLLSS